MIVDNAIYLDGVRQPGRLPLEGSQTHCLGDHSFVWVGLHEPTEDEFEAVRSEFDLPDVAADDAVQPHQRPKLEAYGQQALYLVFKTARYVDPEEVVDFGQIAVFIGHGFIVVMRHGDATSLTGTRQHLEMQPDFLAQGPAAVLHAIVDKVVDDYVPVLAEMDHDIDDVETQVFSATRRSHTERIYKLKREVLEFHRATYPLIDPLDRLARGELAHVRAGTGLPFRDVHDHLLRVVEQIETYRELLTAALTQVSVRQNEDMRRISAWVAILAVPTMIAGIYGMNFEHMPELGSVFGYPIVLALMLVVCTVLYRVFRRSGWL